MAKFRDGRRNSPPRKEPQIIYPKRRAATKTEEAEALLRHNNRMLDRAFTDYDEALRKMREAEIKSPIHYGEVRGAGMSMLPEWMTGGPRQSTNVEDVRGKPQPAAKAPQYNVILSPEIESVADVEEIPDPSRFADSLGWVHEAYLNPATDPIGQRRMRALQETFSPQVMTQVPVQPQFEAGIASLLSALKEK